MQLLKNLKRLVIEDIDTTFTREDIKKAFNIWQESTSTSPSGRHLGKYKAVTRDLDVKDESARAKMLEIQTNMMNTAVKHSIVYERWETVHSLMLEKIKGKPRLEKLWIIHIYKADVNMIMGILWDQRLVAQGEKLQAFGDANDGSRKGRKATDTLMMKRMSYLISELQVKDIAMMDQDAKSCYDRIVILLAMLRSRQLGMPKEACKLMAEFFQKVKYYVKTNAGVSKAFHRFCAEHPCHGTGQGNCGAPANWLQILTFLIQQMELVTDGLKFEDPITWETFQQIMDRFVDDITS